MSSTSPLFSRKEKFLLMTLAFVQFSHIVDFMILMPLGPQLMRMFAIEPQKFGYLVSCYTFAAGATGLLSAFFIDRFDRKYSLLVFYTGFSLGTLACAFANTYESLLLTRTLTGAFGGVMGSLILSIVSDTINPERRATAMGLLMTSFSLASIIGVPFSLFLAQRFGWHAPFLFLGGLSTLLISLVIFAVPPIRSHLQYNLDNTSWARILGVFKSSSQMLGIAFMVFLILGQFTIIPFLSPSIVANAGLPEASLPLIYLVGGVSSIIFSPLIGRAADKFGKRKVFYFAVTISLLPIFIITRLSVTPYYLLFPLIALFFVCMGGRKIPAMAIASSTCLPKNRGSFMSINSSAQQFASAIASFIAGSIVIHTADGHLQNYATVGTIAIGFSLLAMAAASRIVPVDGKI